MQPVNFVNRHVVTNPREKRGRFPSVVMILVWVHEHLEIDIKYLNSFGKPKPLVRDAVRVRESNGDITDPWGHDGHLIRVEEGRPEEFGNLFRVNGKCSNHR
ncbi:hypothetical protein SAMN04489841_1092 [Natrinema salaciae]|uniref:Uncharacterized protein n=1 Tax=Natrinema salaciae TaxID=1186196 RepID=A0A1H9CM78_9EURY|nr:hypothetical protein SAMN04489841_1092 [Natrinema salaciae]